MSPFLAVCYCVDSEKMASIWWRWNYNNWLGQIIQRRYLVWVLTPLYIPEDQTPMSNEMQTSQGIILCYFVKVSYQLVECVYQLLPGDTCTN